MRHTIDSGLALAHEWATSGLTPTQFCRQRGLSRHVLVYWRRQAARRRPMAMAGFVQVPAPSSGRPPVVRMRWGRVTVVAPVDGDVQFLARLLTRIVSC
jgi:hypothetical protein